MKWKKGVTILWDEPVRIRYEDREVLLGSEDAMIARLLEDGVNDDDELLRQVSAGTRGEIDAGLCLAQFVEDYGDFIAEGIKNKTFWETGNDETEDE